ncbi:hypothetical protein MMPV_002253 [Pyropia vietnamensis]
MSAASGEAADWADVSEGDDDNDFGSYKPDPAAVAAAAAAAAEEASKTAAAAAASRPFSARHGVPGAGGRTPIRGVGGSMGGGAFSTRDRSGGSFSSSRDRDGGGGAFGGGGVSAFASRGSGAGTPSSGAPRSYGFPDSGTPRGGGVGDARGPPMSSGGIGGGRGERYTCFVAGLTETDEAELTAYFNDCVVTDVRILRHIDSGNVKHAFVDFADAESQARAIARNGSRFRGRPLRINAEESRSGSYGGSSGPSPRERPRYTPAGGGGGPGGPGGGAGPDGRSHSGSFGFHSSSDSGGPGGPGGGGGGGGGGGPFSSWGAPPGSPWSSGGGGSDFGADGPGGPRTPLSSSGAFSSSRPPSNRDSGGGSGDGPSAMPSVPVTPGRRRLQLQPRTKPVKPLEIPAHVLREQAVEAARNAAAGGSSAGVPIRRGVTPAGSGGKSGADSPFGPSRRAAAMPPVSLPGGGGAGQQAGKSAASSASKDTDADTPVNKFAALRLEEKTS